MTLKLKSWRETLKVTTCCHFLTQINPKFAKTFLHIYINSNLNSLTKFTSSSRSTEFKDNPPWSISQMITKTIPISTRTIINYAMEWGICSEFVGKSMETETKWSKFPNGGKVIVEHILASEERKKSKSGGLWESQSGILVGKLTIWVRSFEFTRSISSTRIG